MTQEIQLRSSDSVPGFTDPLALSGSPPQHVENPLYKAHRALRGRYKWAVMLGLVGLSIGAYLGYRKTEPLYSSSGMIRIKPVITPLIAPSPETGLMPMFESYVRTQVALIQSQRVLDMAMQSDEWKALSRASSDEAFAEFAKALVVTTSGSELMVVSFTDPSPAATTAAVKAVITAYNRIYVEGEIQAEEKRRQVLEDRRLTLSNELKLKRDAILQAAKESGMDDLRSVHQLKTQNLSRLEAALAEVDFALAAAGKKQEAGPASRPSTADLSVTEIAARDQAVRQLLRDQQALKNELEIRYGNLGPNHAKVIETKALLANKAREIEDYVKDYRAAQERAVATGSATGVMVGVSVEQLLQQQARYKELVETAKADVATIGRKMLDIEKLRKEEGEVLQKLDQTNRRIDEINVESPVHGRIDIISSTGRVLLAKDARIQRGVMFGILGGGAGFGLILLLCLMDRRFRSPDDVDTRQERLAVLGILPMLPDDLSDPEQAAAAAHCVHHIRTRMQIVSDDQGHRVFAITSPSSGTGKTSLALALGVSFAATNSRTLMIDCDVVGGGLSRRVDTIVRRKIGQILQREGLLSQQQLEAALKLAHNSKRRLGEILVELKYLNAEDIDRALAMQQDAPLGLMDALSGEDIDQCIAETGVQGLWILPLGTAHAADAGKMAPAAVRRLLQALEERFDTIIIDTGPVPGSLEASIVAAVARNVVLLVSRGENRAFARKAIQHLRELGANVAGIVFNRAEDRDVASSATAGPMASLGRNSMPSSGARGELVVRAESSRYGPIASAVAAIRTAPAGGNGNGNGNGSNGHHNSKVKADADADAGEDGGAA